jgi:hypothetical protein
MRLSLVGLFNPPTAGGLATFLKSFFLHEGPVLLH